MPTVCVGNKMVLLVVDVQVGVVRNAFDSARIVGNVAHAVERARDAGVSVLWVQHADDELIAGSPEWQWVPELVPAKHETIVHKQYNSAFEQTRLEDILAEQGVSHIVLAGAQSNWCIRSTTYAALERGYDLTLLKDAHTTESIEFSDGTEIRAEDVIRELNVAVKWLSYPGRATDVVDAAKFEFVSAQ